MSVRRGTGFGTYVRFLVSFPTATGCLVFDRMGQIRVMRGKYPIIGQIKHQ